MDSAALLDPQELAAIREALALPTPTSATTSPTPDDATPIALIADDRSAARARPDALKLGARWAALLSARVALRCGVKLSAEVVGADLADVALLRERLAASWSATTEIEGRPGHALVSVSGAVIEASAARLLGAGDPIAPRDGDDAGEHQAPSPTSLRLFAPVGEALLAALGEALREEHGCELRPGAGDAEAWRRALGSADVIVELTIALSGFATGRLRLLARPETLLQPPPPLRVVPASPDTIHAVLGEVPVELRADLGRTTLPLSELSQLRAGAIVLLDRAVDEPLPVSCAGQLIGRARVLVSRGALAMKMVDPTEEEENK